MGTYFPGNIQHPAMQTHYFLFNTQESSLLAPMSGNELTYWKSVADSALGEFTLTREEVDTLLAVTSAVAGVSFQE